MPPSCRSLIAQLLLLSLTLFTSAEAAVACDTYLAVSLRRDRQKRRAAILKSQREPREVVARADGGWAGSTMWRAT